MYRYKKMFKRNCETAVNALLPLYYNDEKLVCVRTEVTRTSELATDDLHGLHGLP